MQIDYSDCPAADIGESGNNRSTYRQTEKVMSRTFFHHHWWQGLTIRQSLDWALLKLLASSVNPNLMLAALFLGAFLVPITYFAYVDETGAVYSHQIAMMALSFFYLGVIGSQLVEQQLVGRGAAPAYAGRDFHRGDCPA